MITDILLLLVGLAAVVIGADILVDGSSAIARRFGISEFVIGLTIVGFGTSCPELVVSLTGAIEGNSAIALGNVVGSNIFNTFLILGISAIILPIGITKQNKRMDLPLSIIVTAMFAYFILDGEISRIDAGIMLLVFAAYLLYCFKFTPRSEEEQPDGNSIKSKLPVAIILVISGLAALIIGGRLFVDKAVIIAKLLGVSDKFIAITILAGGTSLPELATSVVAAAKGKDQLALGNIIGSNIFNILLILGVTALVAPLQAGSIVAVDLAMLMLCPIVLFIWTYTGNKSTIDRWEGAVMLTIFALYYIYLFANMQA